MQDQQNENNSARKDIPTENKSMYAFRWSFAESRSERRASEYRNKKRRTAVFLGVVGASFAILYIISVLIYYFA